MADSKDNTFFTLIGRLATILAIILAILKVVDWVNEPRKDLYASISFRDHSDTPDLKIYRERIFEVFEQQLIKEKLASVFGKDAEKENLIDRASSEIRSMLVAADEPYYESHWRFADGFVSVAIQNRGRKSLNGIQISVPFQLAWAEERREFEFSENPIVVEELKPQETKILNIWVRNAISEHSVDKISIVHDEGIATIDAFVPIRARSFALWITKWGFLIVPLMIFSTIMLAPLILELATKPNSNKRAKKDGNQSKDDPIKKLNDSCEQTGRDEPADRTASEEAG